MKRKRISLNDDQAKHFGLNVLKTKRYLITDDDLFFEIISYIKEKGTYQQKSGLERAGLTKETKRVSSSIPPVIKDEPDFKFSAALEGRIMDIDEYCSHYGLPRDDIKSYKLVTHTSVPYYNTQFNEKITEPVVDLECFTRIIESYVEPKQINPVYNSSYEYNRLIKSDVHIGMDNGKNEWNIDTQNDAIRVMANETVNYGGRHLIIDDLGDYMDGYNAKNN